MNEKSTKKNPVGDGFSHPVDHLSAEAPSASEGRKRIKLALVLCGLAYGGAERLVLDLIKKLNRDLFSVYLITVKGGGGLLEEFQKTGSNIYLLNKKSKLGLLTLWRLKKYFQKERIQIVHTHLFAGDTWGRIAAIMAKVPYLISTEHNINLDEGWLKKMIKRWLAQFTHKIIAVSGAVKDYQINTEKIPAKKIQVIYNGIDLTRFPYRGSYRLTQPITLGVIGRLEKQKGQMVALKSLPRILQNYPQTKLLIVGNGSQQPALKKMAEKLNIEKNVSWQRPQENVGALLDQLDILLIPSLWEGLGIIAIEALATGLPVIGSRLPGLQEVIIDNQTGLLVPAANHELLANRVMELIDRPQIINNLRPRGRSRAESIFNIEKTAAAYQKIYLDLYENSPGQ